MTIRNRVAAEKNRAVAVTEEPESVGKSVVIYPAPVSAHESGYKQDQRALRLVEIRNQHIYQPELESRHDDYSSPDLDLFQVLLLQIFDNRVDRLPDGIRVLPLVRHPLPHVLRSAFLNAADPDIVQRLKSAD